MTTLVCICLNTQRLSGFGSNRSGISHDSGDLDAHFLLNTFDSLEDFLEHGLIDSGEMFGVDEIVGLAVLFGNRRDLANESEVHQIAVGLNDVFVFVGGQLALLMDFFQSFQRVGLAYPEFQRIDTGEIDNRHHCPFDVEAVLMLTFGLDNDITEKPQRRFEIKGVLHHIAEKTRPAPQGIEEKIVQFRSQRR